MITLPYHIEGYRPMEAAPLVDCLPHRGKQKAYLEEAIYLDTETSKIVDEQKKQAFGWIYQWAFHFAGFDCCGRYPAELVEDLQRAVKPSLDAVKTASGDDAKVIIFVHNLSYDIQYIKNWLFDVFGTTTDSGFTILAVGPHKFITFSIGPFEFRCTYKLSNRSLDKWGKDLGIEHAKKTGMIDYQKVRYQDDELTLEDWLYQLYDIWALRDCVQKQLKIYGDNLATLPLTSTGYIRREARRKYKENFAHNRHDFKKCRMDVPVYRALKGAAAGGYTHGNRFFEDERVDDLVGHFDQRSHYPTQQVASDSLYGFPTDKFAHYWTYRSPDKQMPLKEVYKLARKNCVLIEIMIQDARLKPGITAPYLMHYKCVEGAIQTGDYPFAGSYWDEQTQSLRPGRDIVDNGRVLEFSGQTVLYLTEWDLKWIDKQYTFKYVIKNVWKSPRGRCPEYLIETVNEHFKQKTDLKNRVKELEKNDAPIWEIIDAKISLMKAKNGLNGIFGMTMTDPVRQEYRMDPFSGEWDVEPLDDETIAKKLEEYYDPKHMNNFMTYAIGVYTTALARNELMEAIEAIGYEYFLYCDTDSVFFRKNAESIARVEKINEWRHERAEALGAFIVADNGEKVYYDVLEDEGENITSFKFLHAKAYAYITDGGTEKEKLHCTIAGVSEFSSDYDPHENKGMTRVEELGTIDDLTHGKTFTATGGTTCQYVEMQPSLGKINGHIVQMASAAIITETTKTLKGLIAKDETWYIWGGGQEIA